MPVGSLNFPTSGYGQTVSYLNLPPYFGQRERFGAGVLPDPVTNSPIIVDVNAAGEPTRLRRHLRHCLARMVMVEAAEPKPGKRGPYKKSAVAA